MRYDLYARNKTLYFNVNKKYFDSLKSLFLKNCGESVFVLMINF